MNVFQYKNTLFKFKLNLNGIFSSNPFLLLFFIKIFNLNICNYNSILYLIINDIYIDLNNNSLSS